MSLPRQSAIPVNTNTSEDDSILYGNDTTPIPFALRNPGAEDDQADAAVRRLRRRLDLLAAPSTHQTAPGAGDRTPDTGRSPKPAPVPMTVSRRSAFSSYARTNLFGGRNDQAAPDSPSAKENGTGVLGKRQQR